MVHRADGVRVAVDGACARHFLECKARAGGDHQIVVRHGLAVGQRDAVTWGVDGLDSAGNEINALALQQRADLQHDIVAFSPAHRDPGIRGHELEVVHRADHGDAMLRGQLAAQLVGCGHAANACSDNDDMGHGLSPVVPG